MIPFPPGRARARLHRLTLALAALIGLLLAAGTPARAAVTVRVDIGSQTMRVEAPGQTYRWAISTGRIGYRTPSGVYRPQRLEKFWRSRRYGMAPMPHSIFFHGGYAIHGTGDVGRLGRPASHGCIRLHPANAATLFNLVSRHRGSTRIVIDGRMPAAEPRVARAEPRRTPRRVAAAPLRRVVAAPRRAVRAGLVRVRQPAYAAQPAPRRGAARYYYTYPTGYSVAPRGGYYILVP